MFVSGTFALVGYGIPPRTTRDASPLENIILSLSHRPLKTGFPANIAPIMVNTIAVIEIGSIAKGNGRTTNNSGMLKRLERASMSLIYRNGLLKR
jgi:hypothetical protein